MKKLFWWALGMVVLVVTVFSVVYAVSHSYETAAGIATIAFFRLGH